MKKLLTLLLALVMAFTCFACIDNNEGDDEPGEKVSVLMGSMMLEGKSYTVSAPKTDEVFASDSTVFNKDLAKLSFAASVAAGTKTQSQQLLTDLGFEDFYSSPAYDGAGEDAKVGFCFARKLVNETPVVAVLVRGFNYGAEWKSNLDVGLPSAVHTGFASAAEQVKDYLYNYLNEKYEFEDVKLWITGYSRGGAVANVISYLLMQDTAIDFSKSYVYTFATPNCVSPENSETVKYANVFNLVNKADAITYFAPESYGFMRCGNDIDIYSANVGELLTALDGDIQILEFNPGEGYATERDLPAFIFNEITSYSSEEGFTLRTRTEYYDNYQPTLCYVAGLIFSIPRATLNQIMADARDMGLLELMSLLAEDGIYNFIKPYLDDCGYSYNDNELKNHTNKVKDFITKPCLNVLMGIYGNGVFDRLIKMHYPETYLVLFNAYLKTV